MEALARSIIEQYYKMDNEQRAFIIKVIELNPNWQKYDFMKALMLFNKSKELNCDLSDEQLDYFVSILDKNSISLNYWLRKFDDEFRATYGYLQN